MITAAIGLVKVPRRIMIMMVRVESNFALSTSECKKKTKYSPHWWNLPQENTFQHRKRSQRHRRAAMKTIEKAVGQRFSSQKPMVWTVSRNCFKWGLLPCMERQHQPAKKPPWSTMKSADRSLGTRDTSQNRFSVLMKLILEQDSCLSVHHEGWSI